MQDKREGSKEIFQVLKAREELDKDYYIIATYYLETPSTDIVKYSSAIAQQQTTGTWVKVHGETSDLVEKHGGRVSSILKVSATPHSYVVEIGYPTSNLTPDFELLLATVAGENSWWVNEKAGFATKLLDLEFPTSFLQEFRGPRYGLNGIRDLLRVSNRPILNSMIKPCTGHSTNVHVDIFREAAFGGVDFIKDDEVLGDVPFNPLFDRLNKCMEIVDRKESEIGERTLYTINITTRVDKILEKAEKTVQAGANGLMIDGSAGFGALRMLAEDPAIKVPILYHPCFNGTMVASERSGISFPLLMKLVRIAGADAMVLYSYLGKTPSATRDDNLQVMEQATRALDDKKTTGCLLAGGIHPGLVPTLVNDFGSDIIIGAGGAVHGHPGGSTAGARAMRQAIDAAFAGVPLEDQAAKHVELRVALDKWGAPRTVEESEKLYTLR